MELNQAKARAWNSNHISQVGVSGAQGPEVSAAFLGALAGGWMGSRAVGTQLVLIQNVSVVGACSIHWATGVTSDVF